MSVGSRTDLPPHPCPKLRLLRHGFCLESVSQAAPNLSPFIPSPFPLECEGMNQLMGKGKGITKKKWT